MKNILITGGTGFIGSNLAIKLSKEKNYKITIVDNLSREGSEKNKSLLKGENIVFNNIDVRNYSEIEKLLIDNQFDNIFHFAAQVAMTESIQNPKEDMEINFLSTFNLLESIRKFSKETVLVYTSSNKVYGDLSWDKFSKNDTRYISTLFPKGYDESAKIDFSGPYGCSKGSADLYALDYYKTYNVKSVVLRLSTIYGPNQYATENQGWIGWFINEAIRQRNLSNPSFDISGDGFQVRDILYIDDLMSLCTKIVESTSKSIYGNAFNIGGGYENSLSIIELFENFIKSKVLDNENYKLNFKERRLADQLIFISSNKKIEELLNWKPQIQFHDGLRMYLDWLEKI